MKNLLIFFSLITFLLIQPRLFAGSVITDSTFLHNQIVNGIDNSSFIFEGEVVARKSYYNSEGNFIYTSNTVKIFQTWKGFNIEFTPEKVEVITRGGSVGSTSL